MRFFLSRELNIRGVIIVDVNKRIQQVKVKKLPSGSYYGEILYKKKRISSTQASIGAVRMDLKKKVSEFDESQFISEVISKNTKGYMMTFDELFDKFIKSKLYNCEKENAERVRYKMYIKDTFGHIFLRNLYLSPILEWYKKIVDLTRQSDGKSLSVVTVNRVIRLFLWTIDYGVNKGLIVRRNLDIENVKLLKITKGDKIKHNKGDDFITLDELNMLCAGIDSLGVFPFVTSKIKSSYLKFLIRFLYFTGMRINEARAITVGDFRTFTYSTSDKNKIIKTASILVNKQLEDNTANVKPFTKNNENRLVDLDYEVYEEFMYFIDKEKLCEKDYIFDYFKTGIPLTRKSFTNCLQKTIKILKEKKLLPEYFPSDFSPHCFRYSSVYYLYKIKGMSVEYTAKMMGHSVSVAMEYYTRIDRKENIIRGKEIFI
jgi:integrase